MLPQDPMILLSYVNTKLRDRYANLEALCEDLQADPDWIRETLAQQDYHYDLERNQFV